MVVAFAEQVRERDFIVGTDRIGGGSVVDFDLGFYRPDNVSTELVRRHVETYLGEKLLSPRRDEFWIGINGELDQGYVQMMRRAIEYAREGGSLSAAERYEHELLGMERLAQMIVDSYLRDGSTPMFVMASDPGNVYVDESGAKKSKTFVASYVRSNKDGLVYSMLDLPRIYLGMEKHWDIIERIGDVKQTQEMLQLVIGKIDANSAIALPILLDQFVDNLDNLARELGFEDWSVVETMADNQFLLESDEYALERRDGMIDYFSELIIEIVQTGNDKERGSMLVNAMADTFALEQGGEYLGLGRAEILREIEKNMQAAVVDLFGVEELRYGEWSDVGLDSLHSLNIADIYQHIAWMGNVFATNQVAMEARATGCGGAGITLFDEGYSSGFEVSYQTRVETEIFGGGLYQGQIIANASEGEEKREKYSFEEEGECRSCHLHSDEVGKLGPCHICRSCDRKLGGQGGE